MLRVEIVRNQTIFFQIYTPQHLSEYIRGAVRASYPKAILATLEVDPLDALFSAESKTGRPSHLCLGTLKLKNQQYLPLKTYQDFGEVDPLASLLSTLSKTQPNEQRTQITEEVQKAIFGNCGNIASFVMGAEDAALFEKEYGDRYTTQDLVSLGRYQIINKITVNGIQSHPFPTHTLSLAKSSNQNRNKVVRVSRERYAKKRQ